MLKLFKYVSTALLCIFPITVKQLLLIIITQFFSWKNTNLLLEQQTAVQF